MDRWEIEKKATIKALKNPAFRKKLLSDPNRALREIDSSLAHHPRSIRVVEEKENEWVLPIPHVDKKLEAMSEAELEKLFGGTGDPDCTLLGGFHCNP